MAYFVYIVQCADKSLYTGIAKDVKNRINKHNLGLGAKYTRSRCPVKLKYFEIKKTRSSALIREAKIKKMTRKQKLGLVASN